VAAEAAQRVLEQVRHGQRAELLLHYIAVAASRSLRPASNQLAAEYKLTMAELRSGMGATIY
jgi:hypothetical protein